MVARDVKADCRKLVKMVRWQRHTLHVESKEHLSDVFIFISGRHLWQHYCHEPLDSQTYRNRQTITGTEDTACNV